MEADGAEEVERCNSEPLLHSHQNEIEEAEDAGQQPAVSAEEKPSTLMTPVLAKSDALQDGRARCRSVAPEIAAEAKADHLGLAKKRKAELEVELELLQAEKVFFDESSKRLQQQLQQLMQVYVSVKRDHSFLNSKFQGSAKEREAREQRLQDHRDWVAMQTRQDIERRICRAQAMVRGHYARKQYARLVKRNKHRNHLLNEVLGTEKTYCESLKRVIKMYKVPLRYACNSSSPIVTETEIDRMFGNMEEIWEFHKYAAK